MSLKELNAVGERKLKASARIKMQLSTSAREPNPDNGSRVGGSVSGSGSLTGSGSSGRGGGGGSGISTSNSRGRGVNSNGTSSRGRGGQNRKVGGGNDVSNKKKTVRKDVTAVRDEHFEDEPNDPFGFPDDHSSERQSFRGDDNSTLNSFMTLSRSRKDDSTVGVRMAEGSTPAIQKEIAVPSINSATVSAVVSSATAAAIQTVLANLQHISKLPVAQNQDNPNNKADETKVASDRIIALDAMYFDRKRKQRSFEHEDEQDALNKSHSIKMTSKYKVLYNR